MPNIKLVVLGMLITGGAAFGALYGYWPGGGTSSAGLLRYADAETIAAGETIYKEHCASCHGANLEGEPNWQRPNADTTMPAPPHSERGHTWHHADQFLFDITKYGVEKMVKLENYKSNMPAYEHVLSDEEIIAVLSYIKSTWPKDIQASHSQLNDRNREATN